MEELKNLSVSRGYIKVIRQTLAALENLDADVAAWDLLLLGILKRKLDAYSARSYQFDRDEESDPSVKDLLNYLERRARALEETTTSEQAELGTRRASTMPSAKKVALAATKTSLECAYYSSAA
ncbi:uncharacterized protein LOC126381206 [Pectinophora gossypiella]|uniref:uncharacterized protein LOC126381206 n=1 Tax=Pectinophora gossypiella TaxID=13191 RepID=UPI00214E8BBF|nr:uncharacterized protein LOC126381206 [Pectinophora gossypiella]